MKNFDIIILGGGASGLMCAYNIDKTKSVAIIDIADKLGKKILVTGNGKCNLTNDNLSSEFYNTEEVSRYFRKYDNLKTLRDFEAMGLYTYADLEGRRYPVSNSANSVLDILIKNIEDRKNISVFTNTNIMQISKIDDKYRLLSNFEEYECDKLVIACGSKNVDNVLQELVIRYNDFVPSLVALNSEKNKGLAGVRVSNVKVKYKGFEEVGEILFKEQGISGIVIFNLSSVFARNNLKRGDVFIDFFPEIDETNVYDKLYYSITNNPEYKMSLILEGLVHKALAKNIIEKTIKQDKSARDITQTELKSIVSIIKNYKVVVTGMSDNNQVNSGGVPLESLDLNLMHKNIKNLFFIGEVVDVDGVCGGYNLQWAWTSGKIVGEAL